MLPEQEIRVRDANPKRRRADTCSWSKSAWAGEAGPAADADRDAGRAAGRLIPARRTDTTAVGPRC